uniref:Uncharacterized protein n=1 Tax=Avena sativa TaxID=4498 RepID=A0ACD5YLS7_AVESA
MSISGHVIHHVRTLLSPPTLCLPSAAVASDLVSPDRHLLALPPFCSGELQAATTPSLPARPAPGVQRPRGLGGARRAERRATAMGGDRGRMVGAQTEVRDVEGDEKVQELGRYSVKEHNRRQHEEEDDRTGDGVGPLEFRRVAAGVGASIPVLRDLGQHQWLQHRVKLLGLPLTQTLTEMDDGAELVSRYMEGGHSQVVADSQVRMEVDYEQGGQRDSVTEDEDDEDQDTSEQTNAVAQGRKFRSKSWREFMPIQVDGEVTQGECKHCSAVISARRGHGTSRLRNHLQRCKAREKVAEALNQMNASLMTPDGVSRVWKWDPDVARKMLVRMVVLHEFPLSIVEYDGFRKFVSSLNPSFHMITRKTLRNDIKKDFDQYKKSLKELFGAANSRISLTMDLWTSNQTIGYMVITAHFINDCWKLEKRIIKFNTLETPHT